MIWRLAKEHDLPEFWLIHSPTLTSCKSVDWPLTQFPIFEPLRLVQVAIFQSSYWPKMNLSVALLRQIIGYESTSFFSRILFFIFLEAYEVSFSVISAFLIAKENFYLLEKQRKENFTKKTVDSWIQESWKHVMSLTIVWHSGQNFHKTIWSSSSGLVMLSFRSCMISVMLVLPEKVIHVEFEVHLKRFFGRIFLKKVKL